MQTRIYLDCQISDLPKVRNVFVLTEFLIRSLDLRSKMCQSRDVFGQLSPKKESKIKSNFFFHNYEN